MGELFDLESYEIGLTVLGLIMFFAAWIPQIFFKRHVNLPLLHLSAGFFFFSFINLDELNPFQETNRWIWEKATELAVTVSLLGAGLKIKEPLRFSKWKPTLLLLLVTMPLTIAALAFLGWQYCGLPLASALLLGAVLAPTDPVLAADIQVAPPDEETKNHNIRFPLTSEAGLNDSFAFPFVYLAIGFALYGTGGEAWIGDWFLEKVVYKIAVGIIAGLIFGAILAKFIFTSPNSKPLAREGLGFVALSILFVSYGGTELIGGYGFLAVFVSAIRIRYAVQEHEYHQTLHEFSENLERSVMAIILVLLGGLATILLPALNWQSILVALLLIFLIRPLSAYVPLLATSGPQTDKVVISFFGVRGIGSIYYLTYAMGMTAFAESEWIWATVIIVVFLSALIHGFSAVPVMEWVDRRAESK